MQDRIDFNIEDLTSEEIVCDIDIEEFDITSLPLVEGERHEQH